MSKHPLPRFQRARVASLFRRLNEERRFLQVVAGPRQVGKTTLVLQVLDELTIPSHYATADEPSLKDPAWLATQWQRARLLLDQPENGGAGAVLVIDEVQKAGNWSETVKRLWDEDTRGGRALHVVLLGSAPLLMQQGLSESLAGRFEIIRLPHWSLAEMEEAFGFSVEDFVIFGGYPGAAPLVHDFERWRRYLLDALIETTISRDVLLMSRVDKPALLRRLFELGCSYSGQILSYTKMLGQLVDAGNTTTLAHYLDLLEGAGMLRGLQKFAGQEVRQRASSPKLQVLNTGLQTAQAGLDASQIKNSPQRWGRWIESAIGAHLANSALQEQCELFYWREGSREVDFVVRSGSATFAIEVKSGSARAGKLSGLERFRSLFGIEDALLVGAEGIPVEEFLRTPVGSWL